MSSLAVRAYERVEEMLPATLRDTLFLRAFALVKIPLLAYVRPKVEEVGDERCVVRIPLMRRTKNHLGSMYFAVLAAGADVAGGLIAMRLINKKGNKLSLVFKDFKADFLSRPEEDVLFVCEDGRAIGDLVDKALESGERENLPVKIAAYVPSDRERPVAKFVLTLSLKKKAK